MMYFLDFDRTCFDTDAFIEYLAAHPSSKKYVKLSEQELGHALNQDAEDKLLVFAPGELSQFLYQDASRFLRDKENGVLLITYGNTHLQRAKVESAIYGIPRISTIYTGDVRKGDFIAPHIGMYGSTPVFVDDSTEELKILSTKCPGAQVFEMRRDGGVGDGRWPVIKSLTELP